MPLSTRPPWMSGISDVTDEAAGAVDAAAILIEGVDEDGLAAADPVQREARERDVVGQGEIAVELTRDLVRILRPRDLEVLQGPQGRDALAVLGANPLHGAAEQVGQEQAIHEHGLRPRDRLLVPGDE